MRIEIEKHTEYYENELSSIQGLMRRDPKGAKMMETTVVVVVIMFTMRTMIILSTVLLCCGV